MGKWLRTRVLGSGSYGTVFLAISAAPGCWNPIAMKSSRLELSRSLQMEEHILKSFTLCPETVQCHGSQITNEQGVLVYNLLLEYAPHGTLSDLINKEPFLETKATKVYIRALLRGLSCIHRKGFVHCDLKPQNILVFPPCPSHQDSEFYQLKIADFGLSRTSDENFNEENWRYKFRGTPIYMSPESLGLGKIEAPLDIWSLGCIVIEMITGFPVWMELQTELDIMVHVGILKRTPKIPSGLSWKCRDFLKKCFINNPAERWTADMLLNHPYLLY